VKRDRDDVDAVCLTMESTHTEVPAIPPTTRSVNSALGRREHTDNRYQASCPGGFFEYSWMK
jgi:hypothetical protein